LFSSTGQLEEIFNHFASDRRVIPRNTVRELGQQISRRDWFAEDLTDSKSLAHANNTETCLWRRRHGKVIARVYPVLPMNEEAYQSSEEMIHGVDLFLNVHTNPHLWIGGVCIDCSSNSTGTSFSVTSSRTC